MYFQASLHVAIWPLDVMLQAKKPHWQLEAHIVWAICSVHYSRTAKRRNVKSHGHFRFWATPYYYSFKPGLLFHRLQNIFDPSRTFNKPLRVRKIRLFKFICTSITNNLLSSMGPQLDLTELERSWKVPWPWAPFNRSMLLMSPYFLRAGEYGSGLDYLPGDLRLVPWDLC